MFKIGQIIENSYNDGKNKILFKINEITVVEKDKYCLSGIIVFDDLYPHYAGEQCSTFCTANMSNIKIVQDVIGMNCCLCNIFYNEAKSTGFGKFICWKCEIIL